MSPTSGAPSAADLPFRLYGRQRGHTLRDRQRRLLETTLPRLRFTLAEAANPAAAFAATLPELWLEIGSGGGEHALAQIAAHPHANLIACEVFEPGICSLLSRLVPEDGEADAPLPPNLRIFTDDARKILGALPDASLDSVFLLFPDPWPKQRHAKRRFVHPANLPMLARALKPGAEWRIASDDPTYQTWTADVLNAQTLFAAAPPATERPPGWPPTRYEAKALAAGRKPLYWSAIRTNVPAMRAAPIRPIGTADMPAVLALNNAYATELSWLKPEDLARLLATASHARQIGETEAFLIAFDQALEYNSPNYLWFRERYDRFIYVDRVVVAQAARGRGHARRLYADLIANASGSVRIVCEVNIDPPNVASDAFHAALGFEQVGSASIHGGQKTVRYLERLL